MENGEEPLFAVFKMLFQLYLEEKGLTPLQATEVNPEHFMAWVKKLAEVGLGPFGDDGFELLEELGVDEEALEAVMSMAENPMGFLRLMPIWHALVLSPRPNPKHPLESFQILCFLRWRDGRASPLAVFAPSFLSSDGFTDATVCGLLLSQSQELMRHIMIDGLDGLHDDKSEQYGGEDSLREFLSLFQACIADLPEEKRPACLNYLRLFQSILIPPVPHELHSQIKKMSAEARQLEEDDPLDETLGGWDG